MYEFKTMPDFLDRAHPHHYLVTLDDLDDGKSRPHLVPQLVKYPNQFKPREKSAIGHTKKALP
jgi:hypothetical protein